MVDRDPGPKREPLDTYRGLFMHRSSTSEYGHCVYGYNRSRLYEGPSVEGNICKRVKGRALSIVSLLVFDKHFVFHSGAIDDIKEF